jgi:hypothetical protein
MISEREFNHDEDEDFTGNFTASADQDYITLFPYPKAQDYDEEAVGKNAARATVKLFPHNFAEKTKHRTYQTDNGKILSSIPSTLPPSASPQITGIRLSIGLQCSGLREDQASRVLS